MRVRQGIMVGKLIATRPIRRPLPWPKSRKDRRPMFRGPASFRNPPDGPSRGKYIARNAFSSTILTLPDAA
jgi:hypothetical protein